MYGSAALLSIFLGYCVYPSFTHSALLLPDMVYFVCDALGQPEKRQHDRRMSPPTVDKTHFIK